MRADVWQIPNDLHFAVLNESGKVIASAEVSEEDGDDFPLLRVLLEAARRSVFNVDEAISYLRDIFGSEDTEQS